MGRAPSSPSCRSITKTSVNGICNGTLSGGKVDWAKIFLLKDQDDHGIDDDLLCNLFLFEVFCLVLAPQGALYLTPPGDPSHPSHSQCGLLDYTHLLHHGARSVWTALDSLTMMVALIVFHASVVWRMFYWCFLDSLISKKFPSISIWTEVAHTLRPKNSDTQTQTQEENLLWGWRGGVLKTSQCVETFSSHDICQIFYTIVFSIF